MKRLAGFIIRFRWLILAVMLLLAVSGLFLIPRVTVVTDMTTYLPKSSPMKQGIDIMKEEFDGFSMQNTIRIMFTGLPEAEEETVKNVLESIENVSSVDHIPGNEDYRKGERTLYIVNTPFDYSSPEMHAIEAAVKKEYSGVYDMRYHLDNPTTNEVPVWILIAAVCMVMAILLAMSPSVVEPILYMATLGIAVAINMGSNIFLGSVSQTTHAIGAVLQLVLSMDYSIMLSEQYRHERRQGHDVRTSMAMALSGSFRPVLSSSFTTIVGLLTLCLMSFRIGADLGIVLSKGVLISLLCVFTVLPVLMMSCDGLIARTQKPVLRLPVQKLGSFSRKWNRVLLVFFLLLAGAALYLRGNTEVTYTLAAKTEIDDYFPKTNSVVVLYDNRDESSIPALSQEILQQEQVKNIISYSSLAEQSYNAAELTALLEQFGMVSMMEDLLGGLPMNITAENGISFLLDLYNQAHNRESGSGVTILELMDFVSNTVLDNPLYGNLVPENVKNTVRDYVELLQLSSGALTGKKHSMMLIQTNYPDESPETMEFLRVLDLSCREEFSAGYYLIGSSPMAYEMSQTFQEEIDRITLFTAGAIFLVVLFTFRSLVLPILLVSVIQTAVYITVSIMGLQGQNMYYLAFLIVQGILMGATIDYAILFTNTYREERRTRRREEALISSYSHAVPTILTSGMIIIIATIVLGYAFEDPSIGQICHTISKGTAASLLLVIFLLPGMLCALDRFIRPGSFIKKSNQ